MRGCARRRRTRWASLGLLGLLAIAAWLVAGPSQLGGPVTYLITSGTSMEPNFHSGDLAITRSAGSYHVGDIVAYRETARSTFLHRIVALDGERFVTKGDNNNWSDGIEPQPSQVLGRLWVHLPGAGRALQWLHTPATVAILVAVVAFTSLAGTRKRQKRGQQDGRHSMNGTGNFSNRRGPLPSDDVLAVAIVVALASLVLAIVAFGQPLHRTGAAHVNYQQSGTFNYGAFVPGGVYSDNQISSGDPVFLALLRNLDVRFDYRFASAAAHNLHGTYELNVELSQESGWRRTINLIPSTPFSGDQATMSGHIPLMDVQALTALFGHETGLKGGAFSLALVPAVHVQGTLASGSLDERYAPRLPFRMDPSQLVLDRSADKTDPLHPSTIGVAARPRLEANAFPLLGMRIPVGKVRLVASLLFLLAAGALVWSIRPALAAQQSDEPARIESRHGALLLNAHGAVGEALPLTNAIDVLQFDDLVHMAEQQGRMILHTRTGDMHEYFVTDRTLAYRYTIRPVVAALHLQPEAIDRGALEEGIRLYGA
jgi:signal peptidase I